MICFPRNFYEKSNKRMNQIIKTSLTSDKMSYKSLTFIELKIDCADIFRGVTAVISN